VILFEKLPPLFSKLVFYSRKDSEEDDFDDE